MTMRVRACVLAVVLVVLGASSVFGQTLSNPTNGATLAAGSPFNSFLVGAPAGSAYAGATNYNLAMNREGNRELGAPVSICAGTVGGTTTSNTVVAGQTSTFNVGDVYTIEYTTKGTAPLNDAVLASTGALGAANLAVSQNGVGQGVTATATAAMITPAVVAGSTVVPVPQAFVTITVTGAPAAATGINCIVVQGIRFDLGNTVVSPTLGAQGLPAGNVIVAAVNQTSVNAQPGTPAAPTALVNALPNNTTSALAGNAFGGVNGGFPGVVTNAVGTAFTTLGTAGALGIANPTGYVSGGFTLTASGTSKSGFAAAAPAVTVGGRTGGGSLSIQQAAIPTASTAAAGVNTVTSSGVALVTAAGVAVTVNLPVQAGGGLLRGFVASGPDTTTWLNASGATTGTQVLVTVNGMPTGSSVVFPASVTSASPGVVLTMTGGGTISAPGGSVTYAATVNEGIATTLTNTVPATSVGPSVDIPFTVTAGTAAGGGATVVITLAPAAGASAIPTYSGINGVTVVPSQVVGTVQTTLFTVGTNQSTKVFPYVTYTGGSTAADYDTGLVLDNNGRGVSVVNGTACFQVGAGLQPPTGCSPFPVAATGNLGGQDGPFTVFFLSSGTTVASIRSTATCTGGGAFPGSAANAATKYNGLTSGSLKQGDYWVALASQVLSCAGITGAWSGQVQIVSDIPGTTGFGFISQFFNASGGATMGYVAP